MVSVTDPKGSVVGTHARPTQSNFRAIFNIFFLSNDRLWLWCWRSPRGNPGSATGSYDMEVLGCLSLDRSAMVDPGFPRRGY